MLVEFKPECGDENMGSPKDCMNSSAALGLKVTFSSRYSQWTSCEKLNGRQTEMQRVETFKRLQTDINIKKCLSQINKDRSREKVYK